MSKTSLSKYDIQNSDSFWAENINILFQTDRLSEFIPLDNMSYNEKLNSIVRFSIYLSLLLFILKGNFLFFYIPIFICVLTYFLNTIFGNCSFIYYDLLKYTPMHFINIENINTKANNAGNKRLILLS